jgi:trimeric autotransporter adhesin
MSTVPRLHARSDGSAVRAGRLAVLGLVCAAAFFARPAASAPGATPSGGFVQRPGPDIVLYVDTGSGAASDANPGTPDLPLKTINGATRIALGDATPHATVIRIAPGLYREAVSVAAPPDIAITYEATQPGAAIITGSDAWSGWERESNVYAHAWPYRWGLAPLPPGWPQTPGIVRRREMIFVNNVLLTQVPSRDSMAAGTFFVDEAGRRVYVWPPAGTDMALATVEVATRPSLLTAAATHLTIQGLVFEHAATFLDGDAVSVSGAHVLIEDAQFLWNNWGGLRVADSTDVTVRGSTASHNGGRGMTTYKDRGLLFEDNQTSYNAWRGAWGGFFGWSQGGIKNLRLHGGTFLRHTSLHNNTYGFWLDFDNEGITIDGGTSCGNRLAGFFVEASQGPVTISHSVICANQGDGLLVHAAARVSVVDSVLYGNGERQQLEVGPDEELVDNWETHRELTVRPEQITLCGNAIVGKNEHQRLMALPNQDLFLRTLRSSRNDFWNPVVRTSVWVSGPGDGGKAYDLFEWQRISGRDGDSVWADPRFTNADGWNFVPLPDSRWPHC